MSTDRGQRQRGGGIARAVLPLVLLAACGQAAPDPAPSGAATAQPAFPPASRPVAAIVSPRFSTEDRREDASEAKRVMDSAGTSAGMTVADIGAGEGYYTVRLAQRVGARGRVVAEDIMPDTTARLAERISRASLRNVAVVLGTAEDPKLGAGTFDQIYLVHMYHEIGAPYEFLWRLRPALKPGGRVVIVDADRPTARHGTPPALLDCELAAVGYARVKRERIEAIDAYVALYEARGPRPEPRTIRACVA
ncbi:MAG: ubiquinone/menaquinone biosynthesis methyltransferase [Sphingomonas bacterium]|nr:methyltransferase domain-containing protein [Sphingomonas bacterium]MDB5688479.1 ubiquinone/menaquinone biosynthesis methyltransferase [Sphingomonas bacterium]